MMIRGRLHIIGGGGAGRGSLALLMAGLVMLAISMSALSRQTGQVEAAPADQDAGSYLGQAKKLLDSGKQKTNKNLESSAYQLSSQLSSSSDRDPHLEQQLRQSIKVATDLINNYRQNGLSSLPSLPNLPGVGTVMRLPDKLLRAELSMIQDEIRMAMEMMNNPLAATMNAPRDIASMFYRMAEQLEQ